MDIKRTSIVGLQLSDQPTCRLLELESKLFLLTLISSLYRPSRDVVTSRSSREFTYISYYF